MKRLLSGFAIVILTAASSNSSAAPGESASYQPARTRRVSFEVNVLWPFFPGGMSEFRLLIPTVRRDEATLRGELVLGTYSDFASRVIRDDSHGKVASFAARVGWRQFFIGGLHTEIGTTLGYRHERNKPPTGATFGGFQARFWWVLGYQHDLGERVYANVRAGITAHLVRTGEFAETERRFGPTVDVNLGFRF